MKIFAILHEPASYTIDRNRAVYDVMGVRYAYMHSGSFAADGNRNEMELLPVSFFALVRRLETIMRENDIVIMNGYTNRVFILLFILNIFYGRAIGIDSDTPLEIPGNPIKRLVKSVYLHVVFGNRHIYGLAGGNGSHKNLFRHYGMPEKRVFLMPMMVDNEKYYNTEKSQRDGFTFLYVGRVVECKNLQVLFDAFVKQFAGNGNVRLTVVGDGELLPIYKQKYSDNTNICFAGKCHGDALIAQYHSADVLVLPSSYEPWGLVVNEAMSSGLPVIVSDRVGAAFDLVEGHNTGVIFHSNDAEELAGKMRILHENDDLRQQMAENAYRRMHDYWNYELYTKCLKDFIEHATFKNHS